MFGFGISRVRGVSMTPRIPAGSFVITNRWFREKSLSAGQVVKVHHAQYGDMIKTIDHVDEQGNYWLRGESKQSVTMAQIGAVIPQKILARVCFVIEPPV